MHHLHSRSLFIVAERCRNLDEAKQHRNKLLFNPPLQTGRRKLGFFAPARKIEQESAGLGLYFRTLEYLLIIVGVACLLAAYPIYSNVQADKTADDYVQIVKGASTSDVATTCKKGYDVRCLPLMGYLECQMVFRFASLYAMLVLILMRKQQAHFPLWLVVLSSPSLQVHDLVKMLNFGGDRMMLGSSYSVLTCRGTVHAPHPATARWPCRRFRHKGRLENWSAKANASCHSLS
jgi:hypothetical protein